MKRFKKELTIKKKTKYNCQVPLTFKPIFFFFCLNDNNKKNFPKEVVEETPLLETLKTRWSKAPENIHMGSILHWVKAERPD